MSREGCGNKQEDQSRRGIHLKAEAVLASTGGTNAYHWRRADPLRVKETEGQQELTIEHTVQHWEQQRQYW